VKFFLPESITEQVQVLGSKNYQQQLCDDLGAENVPESFGGTLKDWINKRMPWSDYLDYCLETKTFNHNPDLPKRTDPVFIAENYNFDVEKLKEIASLKKEAGTEETNMKEVDNEEKINANQA